MVINYPRLFKTSLGSLIYSVITPLDLIFSHENFCDDNTSPGHCGGRFLYKGLPKRRSFLTHSPYPEKILRIIPSCLCYMPTCPICSNNVSSLPQHMMDCHTTPADMVISGVLTKFVRDGDDDAIGCPVSNCTNRHRRRSNFLRHLKNDHDLNSTTPHSNGKRSLSSSLENLSEGAQKKIKLVVDKVCKVSKSDFFSNILLVL